jgi:hypothetical protein
MDPLEVTGICSCCGQALKYSHIYNGKVWGGQCLATHLGCTPAELIIKDGKVDAKAMADRKANAEAIRQDIRAKADYAEAVARPRFQMLAQLPVVKAIGADLAKMGTDRAFSYRQGSYSFKCSVLLQLFSKGFLSDRQLASVAKSVGHKLTEADHQATSYQPQFKWADLHIQNEANPDNCIERVLSTLGVRGQSFEMFFQLTRDSWN